ncbi:MAG: hypothetical protein WCE44_09555 [Candidatus Velthaea sp.]
MALQTLTLIVIVGPSADGLRVTLDGIAATVTQVPYQVLVAGNGTALDQSVLAGLPFTATIVQSPAQVAPGAFLNAVLAHAKGDVVSFLPAGVRPEPWWTVGVFELLERADVGAVAPRIVDESGEQIVGTGIVAFDGVLVPRLAGLARDAMGALEPSALFFAPSTGLSVKREAFDRIGVFDAGFERTLFDLDWTLRARTSALAIVYRPDVTMRSDRPIGIGPAAHTTADARRFLDRWQAAFGTALDAQRFVP